MSFQEKIVRHLYTMATGPSRIKKLLTPVGVLFVLSLLFLLIVIALKTDKLLHLPQLLYSPVNLIPAIPLLAVGLPMMLWSVLYFFWVKGSPVPINPPPRLVTTGLYAYLRNPMLTGVFLVLFGLGFYFKSPALTFIFTPLFIGLMVWEVKTVEEPELEKRLGPEYLEYKKRVPAFFPRLGRK